MQDRQEDRPIAVVAESPGLEMVADHGLQARLPSKPLEDEHGADALDDGIRMVPAPLLRRRADEAVDGTRLVDRVFAVLRAEGSGRKGGGADAVPRRAAHRVPLLREP